MLILVLVLGLDSGMLAFLTHLPTPRLILILSLLSLLSLFLTRNKPKFLLHRPSNPTKYQTPDSLIPRDLELSLILTWGSRFTLALEIALALDEFLWNERPNRIILEARVGGVR